VHVLVARFFHGDKTETKNIVNHKDSNRFNNTPENLEWCTSKENAVHAVKNPSTNKYETKILECNDENGKLTHVSPDYLVYRNGAIFSLKRDKFLSLCKSDSGYMRVSLSSDDRVGQYSVHRMVAIAYISPPPFEGAQVNHKNKDRTDNRVENLEWMTPSENSKHSKRDVDFSSVQKKVHQIDIETGETIKTFDGIKVATRETNTNSGSIVKVCKGQKKTAGGYKWKYA
jgi:hypothetical protein